MTTTTRERYDKLNIQYCDEYDGMRDGTNIWDREKVWSFIETIEKEAEERGVQRGREKMRREAIGIYELQTVLNKIKETNK